MAHKPGRAATRRAASRGSADRLRPAVPAAGAFHQPVTPAPLPLFDYAQRAATERDEQVPVEKVVGALLKRIAG